MPAAAAVTTARFPFSRSDIFFFSLFPSRHCEGRSVHSRQAARWVASLRSQ
jgi:hypothetical protein